MTPLKGSKTPLHYHSLVHFSRSVNVKETHARASLHSQIIVHKTQNQIDYTDSHALLIITSSPYDFWRELTHDRQLSCQQNKVTIRRLDEITKLGKTRKLLEELRLRIIIG